MNAAAEIVEGNLKAKARMDGMQNVLSDFGRPGDTYTGTSYLSVYGLNFQGLNELYNSKGVASAIVDRPAEDSLARGFTVSNDTDNLIRQEFDRLGLIPTLTDGVRWSRLQGGAALVLIARDGRGLSQSLNIDALDEIVEVKEYRMEDISVYNGQLYQNPNDAKYGQPVRYKIKPASGPHFIVHESRLIPIPGDPDPTRGARRNAPWQGRSVLQAVLDDLNRYMQGLFWSLRILERKQSPIYRMKGLADTLDEGAEGEDLIRRRINLVDMARNALNTTAVDLEDEYTIENLGVDGVEKIITEFKIALATSAATPVTVLFGTSPTGLSATGEGEIESYHSKVSHYQNRTLRVVLERLISILWAQSKLRDKEPEDWEIKFNPLKILSAKDTAEAERAESLARKEFIAGVVAMKDAGIIDAPVALSLISQKYPDYGLPPSVPSGSMRAAEADIRVAAQVTPAPATTPA